MKIRYIILIGSALVYGITWSLVYLLFLSFHGMTKMFNEKFIFLITTFLNVELSSAASGLIFAFLDGALFGSLIGFLLLTIYRKNSDA